MRPLPFVLLLLSLAAACRSEPRSRPLASPGPVVTLAGGLTYQVLAEGEGAPAERGDKVSVHYTGTLLSGAPFDSSRERGKPFEFRLGQGQVIAGWDAGLVGMKPGERRRLTVPPALGYGSSGSGPIPPNATLVFDIELVGIR